MAASRAQQIGIWVIAVVLTIGTIGSFVIIILSTDNQKNDQAKLAKLTSQYQEQVKEYQAKVDAQATELSSKYFSEFNQYATRPAAFDKVSVTGLKTEDLKIGDGADITADSTFSAYYIGWNPGGTVFDGSIDGTKLKAPLSVSPGGVIAGWTEGVVGMKVGGVRELTIPADKAYGEKGSGDNIPPNTPIKFVVMIIPTPEVIEQPQPSAELIKYYSATQ
ncbi:MAG: FKBP-type peptidyl-prolyl cis-trans isomerase [Candidatus Microsaccharimonas sp.]